MKFNKTWTAAFLGITGLALGMELLASFDNYETTSPWTQYIVNFIPSYVTLPVLTILYLWLIKHFHSRYKEKK